MRALVSHLGSFPTRLWHRFGLVDHRKAWCGRPDSALGPARRFSTRFGTRSRCANLPQNAGHDPAHLSWGDRTLLTFPRMQQRLAQVLAEQQLIAGTGHEPTPALDLLRCAQVGRRPEQLLLEEAVAMLL